MTALLNIFLYFPVAIIFLSLKGVVWFLQIKGVSRIELTSAAFAIYASLVFAFVAYLAQTQ